MYKPIESYGVIGDMHTVALVNMDGAIDWCCLPHFSTPQACLRRSSMTRRAAISRSPPRWTISTSRPVEEWLLWLRSHDALERRLAAYALGEIGPAAKKLAQADLLAALDDTERFVRVWAAAALARVAPENLRLAMSSLAAATFDEVYWIRSLAAWHLGRLGPATPDIDVAMPALLHDEDRNFRIEADIACKRLRTQKRVNQ